MLELLLIFIESSFQQNTHDEILRSFNLFDKFRYLHFEEDYSTIISREELDTGMTCDLIIEQLNKQLDFVLSQHCIKLSNECQLWHKNDALHALYGLQHLDNYQDISAILNNSSTNEEYLAEIMATFGSTHHSTAMTFIDSVDDVFINTLKKYISNKESLVSNNKSYGDDELLIAANLRLYKAYLGDVIPLGIQMAQEGMLLNQQLKNYLPYVIEHMAEMNVSQKVINILSVILLTKEGITSPLQVFHDNSGLFFNTLDVISEANNKMVDLLSDFQLFKETENDKTRLS